jgi:two-component system response regulator QseB
MRILLVEDEPDIAKAVRSALAGEGYAVDHALDATSALGFAAVYPYDLVILDRILSTDHLWTGARCIPPGSMQPC